METRTLLVALSLACLEMRFVVKGPGAVILLFRLEYKTIVVCHNVYTHKVKIVRRDRPQPQTGVKAQEKNLNRTLYNKKLIQFARIPVEFVVRFIRYQYRMKVMTFSIAA